MINFIVISQLFLFPQTLYHSGTFLACSNTNKQISSCQLLLNLATGLEKLTSIDMAEVLCERRKKKERGLKSSGVLFQIIIFGLISVSYELQF